MDNNPLFAVYGYEYVNNPVICAQINNFVAINSVAAIDLTGQWTVGVTNTYGAYFPVAASYQKAVAPFWQHLRLQRAAQFPAS